MGRRSGPASCAVNIPASPNTASRPAPTCTVAPCSQPATDCWLGGPFTLMAWPLASWLHEQRPISEDQQRLHVGAGTKRLPGKRRHLFDSFALVAALCNGVRGQPLGAKDRWCLTIGSYGIAVGHLDVEPLGQPGCVTTEGHVVGNEQQRTTTGHPVVDAAHLLVRECRSRLALCGPWRLGTCIGDDQHVDLGQ